MATIINNPGATTESTDSSGYGFFLGVLLLLAVAFLFFVYGLPAITRTVGTPNVSIPDKVDVNVNTPNTGTGQ